MLTVFVGGQHFGLPDASPFVTKVIILLKMAGVPYETAKADFNKAPKGKIPYIKDGDGPLLGDSSFIRQHLETKYGANFDGTLSAAERGVALAIERLCEDHLYWAVVHNRWMDRDNFNKGPRHFFDETPAVIRPLIIAMVHRQFRRNLKGHGLGRHTDAEITQLAVRDLAAISDFMGDKPWLMGHEPCGADATVWSIVTSALCPFFESPIRKAGEHHANLMAYRDRGMVKWFTETQHAT